MRRLLSPTPWRWQRRHTTGVLLGVLLALGSGNTDDDTGPPPPPPTCEVST